MLAAQRRAATTMSHDTYSDDFLKETLNRVRTIAVVGASANWNRPSFFVMKYLQAKGFRIIPVNPKEAGSTILGEAVYASLAEIPCERAEAAGATVVMNRCPKIEYSRLYGELSWGGFNSGVISSKRRKA